MPPRDDGARRRSFSNEDGSPSPVHQTGSVSRKRPRNKVSELGSMRDFPEPESELRSVCNGNDDKNLAGTIVPCSKRQRGDKRQRDTGSDLENTPSIHETGSPLKKRPRHLTSCPAPTWASAEQEIEPQSQQQPQPPKPDQIQSRLRGLLSFWLSPHNLSKDAHLIKALTEDSEGWTPVTIFLSFNQIRALSAQPDDIICALRSLRAPRIEFDGENSDICDANTTDASKSATTRFRLRGGTHQIGKDVARVLANVEHRTVFVTHVPPQMNHDLVENAFRIFGKVVFVSLPRLPNGTGKGFAFVEYATVYQAKRCIASISRALGSSSTVNQHPLPTLPTVRVFPHAEWKRRQNSRKQRNADRLSVEKVRRNDAAGEHTSVHCTTKLTTSATTDCIGETECEKKRGGKEDQWTQGLILHVRGLSKASGRANKEVGTNRMEPVSRRRLYEAFEEYGAISFIEYSPKRKDECFVRFLHPSGASRALAALTGMDPSAPHAPRASVLGTVVNVDLLAGQRERDYWHRVFAGRADKTARKARRNGTTK